MIELLVVIAIIAILIGLLLPAVQKVREAAARMRCQNNLKQLAIACHTYQDVNGGLPPVMITINGNGWNRQSETTTYGPNWVVQLLPYIEQQNLFNAAQNSVNNFMNGIFDHSWRNIRGTTLPPMLCPSDPANTQQFTGGGGGWARGNYAANQGPGSTSWDGGNGNTLFIAGVNASGRGPFWITTRAPHRCMSIQGIQDGSSNTIMIGEVRAGLVASDPRGVWALGHAGSSSVVAYAQGDNVLINNRNANSDDVEGASNNFAQGMGNWTGCVSTQAIFRSMHTGGVNVALADASVRFLRDSTPQALLWQLGSAQDGLPITGDF